MSCKIDGIKSYEEKYRIIIDEVKEVLGRYYPEPMTLRQIYYRLVARLIFSNTENNYKLLSRYLVTARETYEINYKRIEDRARTTIGGDFGYTSTEGFVEYQVKDFLDSWKRFNLSKWGNQDEYLEVWVEKDALSRTVSNVAHGEFYVMTCPSRGYSSFSYIKEATNRLIEKTREGKTIVILYLGDYDPSGLDITRDLHERLIRYGVPFDKLEVDRIALNYDQIKRYELPPMPAKKSDVRYEAFVRATGTDEAVELDALEPTTLQEIIRIAINDHIDQELWEEREEESRQLQQELKDLFRRTYIEVPGYTIEFKDEEDEEFY